jgi:5-methylcytosine-specific restriction enzyme subunit McrC
MEIIPVLERKEIDLPIEKFFAGGRLNISPAIQTKRYIDIKFEGNRLALITGKYIGLIPLNNQYAVHVQPKVPISNLITILTTSQEEPEIIEGLKRLYSSDKRLNLFELLVHALHREINVLEIGGLHREYVRLQSESSNFTGKLLLKETLLKQWPKGIYHRASLVRFEYSRDVIINRAIHYTIWHVLRTYPQMTEKPDRTILRDLDHGLTAFNNVTLDRTRSFLPLLRKLLINRTLPYSRAYMRRLLNICLMILDDLGVEIEDIKGQDVSLPPLVINMERVFQQFIFYSVKNLLSNSQDLNCWDTTRHHRRFLFRVPAASPKGIKLVVPEQAHAEPDFVIAKRQNPVLVCDVKYSTMERKNDIYQIVTHTTAYGARNALLIYPEVNDSTILECKCMGLVGDVQVFSCEYPLNTPDLNIASMALVEKIISIISGINEGVG